MRRASRSEENATQTHKKIMQTMLDENETFTGEIMQQKKGKPFHINSISEASELIFHEEFMIESTEHNFYSRGIKFKMSRKSGYVAEIYLFVVFSITARHNLTMSSMQSPLLKPSSRCRSHLDAYA